MNSKITLDKLASLAKRRGFFYPSADIYGGVNGVYDKGHLGSLLEDRLIYLWKRHIKKSGFQITQLDGSLLGPEIMWKASGHVDGFHDLLIDCKECKARFRDDEIDFSKNCPRCGKKNWSEARQFNMMFKTSLGAASDSSNLVFLRPETAQNIFVQFKNIWSTARVKIPFGVMQIGKSFRNEITPRQLLFRMREFSQMEMEFFCHPNEAQKLFDFWVQYRLSFYESIGIQKKNIQLRKHDDNELSHYSNGTYDVEFNFPFGIKELEGIAYRTNFDLTEHSKFSQKDLSLFDDETKKSYVPHVIECSVGLERLLLAVLSDAYDEQEIEGETRVVLKLHQSVAPVFVSILPLTKNEESYAKELFKNISNMVDREIFYDESGSVGKRYRRADEIGVPYCITVDSTTLIDDTVTIRFRDSMQQERLKIIDLYDFLKKNM